MDNYKTLSNEFVKELTSALNTSSSEINERNTNISERDLFIYGDGLQTRLNIPRGHDFTPVNWLRRTIEIHRTQFMGRGFQIISTYDTDNIDTDDPQESGRLQVENDKKKTYAEQRKNLCDAIMKDNGGKKQE